MILAVAHNVRKIWGPPQQFYFKAGFRSCSSGICTESEFKSTQENISLSLLSRLKHWQEEIGEKNEQRKYSFNLLIKTWLHKEEDPSI